MEQHRLTHNNASDGFNGLTWMPDSQGIAFVRAREIYFDEDSQTTEEQQIDIVNISNLQKPITELESISLTQNVHLCDVGEVYHNPSWSLVTNQLVFALSCGGGDDMDIYLMDMSVEDTIDNPTLVNLTNNVVESQAGFQGIAWDNTNTRINFIGFVDDETPSSEIFIVNIANGVKTSESVISQITNLPTGTQFRSVSWRSTNPDT